MPPARTPDVVKVSTPSDLVAAVPHLLGFVPAESVVVLGLTGPRGRIVFTMRLDLEGEGHDQLTASRAARCLDQASRQADVDAAAVFIFTNGEPGIDGMPRRPLVEALDDELPVPVREAVLVSGERFWAYFCQAECCPAEGSVVDRGSDSAVALAAAHALHGRAVLASRDEVVRSVAAVGGVTARSMSQALTRATIADACCGPVEAEGLLDRLLVAYDDGRLTLDHDQAAQLIVACNDRGFREVVATRLADDPDDDALAALLRDLARLAQPPLDAGICSLLALAAYLGGDGVVADASLCRALSSDADHSFALLLRAALDGQVHPRALARALRAPE
jgi:hypothetical protein